ncbi:WD repeat-containing protein 11-like isoform X2 [Ptychodera flava]|uniref:WD repeat-containing protein 11-like isoform X2 n=1 Tax=Ptychodera flava TaxID=63121 RepID=UPI003969FFC6
MSTSHELQKHLLNLKLSNKTLTGVLHNNNKGASDWGWQGLLAYGCQTSVVIVDARTVQVLQTLERHKAVVLKVKWARQNYHHDERSPYTLRLASADCHGRIIVWDVSQAAHRVEFQDGTKPIVEMEWLSTQDASHDLLVALHPPYSIILWNADTGTKLWKKSFTENLMSFSFDPFDPTKLTLLGPDCILFVSDFSISKPPSSNGRKFYVDSTPSSAPGNVSGSGERRGSARTAFKRVKMLVGEGKPRNAGESVSLNECLQLTYHQACRHHLLLVYSREILIVDLEINQTVGVIPMERNGSPFLQVISCRQRDVMMCLHENGSITVRVRRKNGNSGILSTATTPVDPVTAGTGGDAATSLHGESVQDVIYDLRCQSDHLRVTKHVRPFGIYRCPVTERSCALIMNDGRIMIWSLKTTDHITQISNSHIQALTPLHSPGYSSSDGSFEILQPVKDESNPKMEVKFPAAASHPKTCLSDLIGQVQSFGSDQMQQGKAIVLKFVLVGLLNGVTAPPLVIRMCPPLTTKNFHQYQPLVALGSSSGLVQVYNLSSGLLWREYNIHLSHIRGIEWVSLNSFLSYGYTNPNSSGLVRNELILTDMETGSTTSLRNDKNEESPIEILRVSQLKQYFIIVFKEKPFELWDLRTGTLLREMPKNFPMITALEWSPSSNLKGLKKRLVHDASTGGAARTSIQTSDSNIQITTTASPGSESGAKADRKLNQPINVKEHFVFTDTNGLLYHFFVEGNTIKDGAKIPPEGGMGSVTCIAWKADTIVLGDVDGNLSVWDLKARVSRAVPTHRGWVKKIKFAPGKGNHKLLVLYNDGMDIWDTKDVEQVSNIRSPREIAKITDVEWATSDKPILATNDGCIRVFDLSLKVCSSPSEELAIPDPLFSPHLLLPKSALNMKYLLQHQPWNPENILFLKDLDLPDADKILSQVNDQIKIMPSDVKLYLPSCRSGVAHRCLLTARLFGDEAEVDFWTVAMYYLKIEQARLGCPAHKDSHNGLPQPEPPCDVFLPKDTSQDPDDRKNRDAGVCECLSEPPLDTCYDVLCDNQSYKIYQLDRLNLHDSKRTSYEHTKNCAENFMLLSQITAGHPM